MRAHILHPALESQASASPTLSGSAQQRRCLRWNRVARLLQRLIWRWSNR